MAMAVSFMACNHADSNKDSQTKTDEQEAVLQMNGPVQMPKAPVQMTAPQMSAQFEDDNVSRPAPGAPGSPQNPLKFEEGKPLDLTQLFNGGKTMSMAERAAADIDSIQKKANDGNIDYQYFYGVCFEQGWGVEQDYDKALEWYHKAADHGQKNALGAIGSMYRLGRGVDVDGEAAANWFRKGADANDPNSMLCLGNCYYSGVGVSKDLTQAFRWWQQAADLGNGFAMSQLGDCYYGGLGTEKNLEKAVKYYKDAVAQDVGNAQYRLGVLSYYGTGVNQDKTYAELLLTKAKNQGVEQAVKFLEKNFNK